MAELELLADASLLATYLEDDEIDENRADLMLRLASGEVRAHTGNLFSRVDDDVVILNGTGSTILLLPEAPVVDVTMVLEGVGRTTELDLVGGLVDSPSWEWDESGILERLDGIWARRRRWYQVTYSHGFETIPDEVVAVVLEAASNAYLNPDGIRQEALGRYSYSSTAREAGVGLTDANRSVLDPYFVSLRMRSS